MYLKLYNSFEKGYFLILNSNKISKPSLITLKNTYLNRCAFQFKNAGIYLKSSRHELLLNSNLFSVLYLEMKNIASLLMQVESDINFLIMNVY